MSGTEFNFVPDAKWQQMELLKKNKQNKFKFKQKFIYRFLPELFSLAKILQTGYNRGYSRTALISCRLRIWNRQVYP